MTIQSGIFFHIYGMYLQVHPSVQYASELEQEFTKGFRLHYSGELGSISSPYDEIPLSSMRVFPMGLIPKSED